MDLTEFSAEARKRITSTLPPKHQLETIIVKQKFSGFCVGKKSFLSFQPVSNVTIQEKDDKFIYEVKSLNPEYAELAKKIGEQLSKIT